MTTQKITHSFLVMNTGDNSFQIMFAVSATITSDAYNMEASDIITRAGSYSGSVYIDKVYGVDDIDKLIQYLEEPYGKEDYPAIGTISISNPNSNLQQARLDLEKLVTDAL